jgi:hypothetical protein
MMGWLMLTLPTANPVYNSNKVLKRPSLIRLRGAEKLQAACFLPWDAGEMFIYVCMNCGCMCELCTYV